MNTKQVILNFVYVEFIATTKGEGKKIVLRMHKNNEHYCRIYVFENDIELNKNGR